MLSVSVVIPTVWYTVDYSYNVLNYYGYIDGSTLPCGPILPSLSDSPGSPTVRDVDPVLFIVYCLFDLQLKTCKNGTL